MDTIRITLDTGARMPTRGSPGASGYDLYANESVDIRPGCLAVIDTGVSLELPPGWEAQVRPRSGLTKTGLLVQLGTIDSDYRGTIGVIVANHGGRQDGHDTVIGRRTLWRGDRIAQLVFARVEHPSFVVTDSLSSTDRGTGGFGSTGQ